MRYRKRPAKDGLAEAQHAYCVRLHDGVDVKGDAYLAHRFFMLAAR
jgi:hypothetical protein